MVDAYAPNDGFPLAFAYTFVAANGPASAGLVPATAVLVLRHTATPLALDHTMWQKYKIGQSLSIVDPESKAPAVKNPFLQSKPGVLLVDDMAIDRLLADGAVIGACKYRAQGAERYARWQRRRERRRSREGVGRERYCRDHGDPVGNVGPQPSPGARVHLLRRGLIRVHSE